MVMSFHFVPQLPSLVGCWRRTTALDACTDTSMYDYVNVYMDLIKFIEVHLFHPDSYKLFLLLTFFICKKKVSNLTFQWSII